MSDGYDPGLVPMAYTLAVQRLPRVSAQQLFRLASLYYTSQKMPEFAILTNRKRAMIALVHSVIFLLLALRGFAFPRIGVSLHSGTTADFLLLVMYLTVASILIWLAGIARCARERIYFGFCAASASFGLLRTLFGDAALPAAQYLRVVMLVCAVFVGTRIWRFHSEELLPD